MATALSNSLQQWNHTYANMRISGLSEEMSRNNTEYKTYIMLQLQFHLQKQQQLLDIHVMLQHPLKKNSELLAQLAPLPQLASKRGEMMQNEQLFQKPHILLVIFTMMFRKHRPVSPHFKGYPQHFKTHRIHVWYFSTSYTLEGTITYPTLGKGKSYSKCHFWWIC